MALTADMHMELAGLEMGPGKLVDVTSIDTGSATIRSQDVDAVTGDYRIFGRDQKTPPTFTIEGFINAPNMDAALDALDELETVWDAAETRQEAGAVLPLRYRLNGRERVVYGRPRRFAAPPMQGLLMTRGRIDFTAEFELAESLSYSATLQTVEVGVNSTENSGGGFQFPVRFPYQMLQEEEARSYEVTVAGRKPTWIEITFKGPVSNPWVQIGDLRWQLNGGIAYDGWVRVSGWPWDQVVVDHTGKYLPGMLEARARLADLRLPPGNHQVLHGGVDVTGSARALIAWRHAYTSI